MSKNNCSQCPFYYEYQNCYDGDGDAVCECGIKKRPCNHSMIIRKILSLMNLLNEALNDLIADIRIEVEETKRIRLEMTEEEYFEYKCFSEDEQKGENI